MARAGGASVSAWVQRWILKRATACLAAIITQPMIYRTLAGMGLRVYLPVWLTGLGRFDRSDLGKVSSGPDAP